MSKKSKRVGVVYSTNPEYEYQYLDEVQEVETLPVGRQRLRVVADRRQRGGKVVTIVSGFVGNEEDLSSLGKYLKTKCGVGGTVKDGDIIIQGDFCEKVVALLVAEGYKVK